VWIRSTPWQTGFVQNQVNRLDAVFPMAAAVALDLIQRGEVRDQWLMPSALPKMSTGTLTCHLGRQVVRAAELLPVATDGKPGRIGSVIGPPAPLTGCPPASNCMDTLTASRAPSGQNPLCSVIAIDSFICVRVREPASRSTAHPFSQAPLECPEASGQSIQ
jgi:hypothetical protein